MLEKIIKECDELKKKMNGYENYKKEKDPAIEAGTKILGDVLRGGSTLVSDILRNDAPFYSH